MTEWYSRICWILTHRLYYAPASLEVVYHAKGHEFRQGVPGEMEFGSYSRCGLLIDHYRNGQESRMFTMFDRRIARQFARPCRHCFPEGDDGSR